MFILNDIVGISIVVQLQHQSHIITKRNKISSCQETFEKLLPVYNSKILSQEINYIKKNYTLCTTYTKYNQNAVQLDHR